MRSGRQAIIRASCTEDGKRFPRGHLDTVEASLEVARPLLKVFLPIRGLAFFYLSVLNSSAILDTSESWLSYLWLNYTTTLSTLAMGIVWNARLGAFEQFDASLGPLERLPNYPRGTTPASSVLEGTLRLTREPPPSYVGAAQRRSQQDADTRAGNDAAISMARRPAQIAPLVAPQAVGSGGVRRDPVPLPTAAASNVPAPVIRSNLLNIRPDHFVISFQVYVEIKGKRRKNIWKNVVEPNIHIPADFFAQSSTLLAFKKLCAGHCVHGGLPMKRPIVYWDKQGHLKWRGHVNGTLNFARNANVELKDEDVFQRFLTACSGSNRTMGVRISMENPSVKAVEMRAESAVRSTLKRMNKEHAPSSGDIASGEEASDELSDSDVTLQDGEAQELANACVAIRKTLLGTDLTTGEAPYCAHPEFPRQRIRITNPLLRVWAQDLVNKVPGVSTTVPPMSRPGFHGKGGGKRTCGDGHDRDVQFDCQTRYANGPNFGDIRDAAAALAADVPMTTYIHFANICNDEKVKGLCQALGSLGIDHWSILLSKDCLEPLKDAGVDFGTRQKLVISAHPFEMKLINEARDMLA